MQVVIYFYLERHKERLALHLLVQSLNAYSRQKWDRVRPGAWKEPDHQAIVSDFQEPLVGGSIRSRAVGT